MFFFSSFEILIRREIEGNSEEETKYNRRQRREKDRKLMAKMR